MDGHRRQRVGAVLLIAGGLLEAGVLAIGSLVSPPATTAAGAGLLAGYALGQVGVGAGLVASGLGLAGRAGTAVGVAGVLGLVMPVVNAAQLATGSPFGPAPSQLSYALFVLALVIAAVLLLAERARPRAVRWSVAVPAIGSAVLTATVYAPVALPPGLVVLPWLGTAAAGVLLLLGDRPRRDPDGSSACLRRTRRG